MTRKTILVVVVVLLLFIILFDSPTPDSDNSTILAHGGVSPIASTPGQDPKDDDVSTTTTSVSFSPALSWANRVAVSCEDFSPLEEQRKGATLSLLGQHRKFTGNHICSLEDVVIDGTRVAWRASGRITGPALQIFVPPQSRAVDGDSTIFRSPMTKDIQNFPFSLFGPRFSTRILELEESYDDTNVTNLISKRFQSSPLSVVSTAVFLPISYEFAHPTHALESLGVLAEWVAARKSSSSSSAPAIERIILPQRAPARPGSLQHAALSCTVFGSLPAGNKILRIGNEVLLVRSLIVPGSSYNIFSSQQQAAAFLSRFHACLSQSLVAAGGEVHTEKKNSKKIVFLRREGGRRQLIGLDTFAGNLRMAFRRAKQEHVEIGVADSGVSAVDLFAQLRDSDVLVSIHGGQLSNMLLLEQPHHDAKLFQNKTLVEINPFLFAEPRFRALAKLTGLQYVSVNCVSQHCAFGGDRQRQQKLLRDSGVVFDEASCTLAVLNASNAHEILDSATWPNIGYPGDAVMSLIGKSGGLQRSFTRGLREADVKLEGRLVRDLACVLFETTVTDSSCGDLDMSLF